VSSEKRVYQLKERARRQAETRRRIVEATVALHEEKGPAATTVAEIARRAGVSRLTVYDHFPDQGELFAACQHQFSIRHPLPDLGDALALVEPGDRVREALTAVYRSHRRRAPMTSRILRDRKAVPALDALLLRTLDARQTQLADALLAGFTGDRRTRQRTRAVIMLALDFFTWQRLTGEGVSDEDAARLMADLVVHTAGAHT
jgi:AcrR family transcriptional regulator